MDWSGRRLLFGGGGVGANTLGECGMLYSSHGKRKKGQVRRVGRSRKRKSGLQVPGSLLGQGGAVSGSGRVGCLLTTDKLRCFHW